MTPREAVLAWARGNSPIAVHPAYIRMAGDVGAGVLLSQIVYWHSDTKEGQRRGGVDRDGETWVAKPAGEWARELGLDPDSGQGPAKVVRRYLTHLQAAGLVETDVFKFNGAPTLHVRVRWENFDAPLESGNGVSENPEMESPEIHIRKMDFPTGGKSSKEAETTSETTNPEGESNNDSPPRRQAPRRAIVPAGPRPRDVMFDAFCVAWGYDPDNPGQVRGLAGAFSARCKRLAPEATPADLTAFCVAEKARQVQGQAAWGSVTRSHNTTDAFLGWWQSRITADGVQSGMRIKLGGVS